MRVNELSKELGKTNKEVLEVLQKHNFDVKSHASNITEEQAAVVKKEFNAAPAAPAAKETVAVQKSEAKAPQAEAAKPAASEENKETVKPKKRFATVFRPQNSVQKSAHPGSGAKRPARPQHAGAPAAQSAVQGVKVSAQTAEAAKPAPKAETPAAAPQAAPAAAAPAPKKEGHQPRVFTGPISIGRDFNSEARRTELNRGNITGNANSDARAHGTRDGGARSGGYQGRNDGARSGGYQGRNDGARSGGYQGRDGGARSGGYQGRDGGACSGGYQGRNDGARSGGFQGRGAASQGASRGGYEEKPLQKQQNSKQNRNNYKGEKGSRFDREEEKFAKGRNGQDQRGPVKPQRKPEPKEEKIKVITIPEQLTVRELAEHMKMKPATLIMDLFKQGKAVTINTGITYDQAEEIAMAYDILCEKEKVVDVIAELLKEDEEDEADMVERPPVVCVMGHVDHGKTSLLDAIRKTAVTEKEAGGITQRIGAYQVEVKVADGKKKITFLDTPGHEAFTAMRMRGAQSTDIAVLVVAADDGVMPQTVEAINHAKAAKVEMIVAINKIDKPSADPSKVKQELSQYGVLTEDWGGDVPVVEVSAKSGQGIQDLLEELLLVAEISELKADPKRNARGLIIEASLDKGRGPVATVLVQKGTLHVGDPIVAGHCYGKVRAMTNENGRRLKEAGPSTPVEVIGFNDVPAAGEVFMELDSEKEARSFAETFIAEHKNKLIEETKMKLSLDDLFSQIKAGTVKELPIVVKADVQGSVEAVRQSLEKLSNDEVLVKIIHSGVGAINESDISLASASNAIVIGFNVRPDATAKALSEHEKVDVRLYKVIYQAIDDVRDAMSGMYEPVYEEQIIGHGEVRQVFKASKVGMIAGTYVLDGKFSRGCKARVSRGGKQIFDGNIESLKRFKDDVKDVNAGYECGVVFEGFSDVQEGDQIEAYAMVEVPRDKVKAAKAAQAAAAAKAAQE
ncbi:MAG: translation initiation factor IF-2 [[Clostridium] aminophilum]|uniref:translation initiation factor IF-2 n=1 Tax=[Clostridium] aminophilum TaxID=1526 RepID=UPI0026EE8DF4|nr:translation initiation factor IF-2 [[Clostridium] aminophilum]MDD6196998.1 translation initiation factor IF-2 [[Clostridium] aminophilum]